MSNDSDNEEKTSSKWNFDETNHFRFRRLDGQVLITNDLGHFEFLTEEEFTQLTTGEITQDHPKRLALEDKMFMRGDDRAQLDRFRKKNHFLMKATQLHIVVMTLRCDHQCKYCHSSIVGPKRTECDMTDEICDQVVDRIFESPSPTITIEFQGGEPLLAWPRIKRIINRAAEKNKTAKKTVLYSLVTNMGEMTDEIIEDIVERRIQVCTSLDGSASVHDANRPKAGVGSTHAVALENIAKLRARFTDKGWDPDVYNVGCIFTTTRNAFGREREIIDQYVDLGLHNIHLRMLDPLGFAVRNRSKLGYTREEFHDFYFKALDYIIELNREGVEFAEITASLHLKKILTGTDPNYLDLRSPCGATIGQIAYDWDGKVFTCDEGRMLAAMGDDRFCIGRSDNSWEDFVKSEVTRATIVASTLDGVPGCSDCAYKPYCGICPVFNVRTHGSIFGMQLASAYCQHHMAVQDWIFRKLRDDPDVAETFQHWVQERPQTEWLHNTSPSEST